nr:MAG TPA: hypothetical protein [Bacteriophage sp.]
MTGVLTPISNYKTDLESHHFCREGLGPTFSYQDFHSF